MTFERHLTAKEFLARATPFLDRAPAVHRIIYLVTSRHSLKDDDGPHRFYATFSRGGEVEAAAICDPPFGAVLGGAWSDGLESLALALGEFWPELPSAQGPEDDVCRFIPLWARAHDCHPVEGLGETHYELRQLVEPRTAVGKMQAAEMANVELVTTWFRAFWLEAGLSSPLDFEAKSTEAVEAGRMYLWLSGGEPVAMAGRSERFGNGASLGPVYTPPHHRKRGYATNLVAAMCRTGLADGLAFLGLTADRENPTSNLIYQRLGFNPVAETQEVRFIQAT